MPKPKPATFFESPQGAAILKHGILRQYLAPFVSKTGSVSTDHRVVYVDTHAGGGSYDEGTPGSPSLAAVTASKLAHIRNLDCIYVEEDPEQAKKLSEVLKGFSCEIINDTIENALDYVLEKAGTSPAFWFIDPFGLALPFNQMRKIMGRAGKTELLVNVAISAIRRCAGLANPKALNAMMDGDWWQDAVWKKHEDGDTRERDGELVYEYRKRLAAQSYMNWQIPVADLPGAAPSYYLAFFTQAYDGLWSMLDASSLGIEEQRRWCIERAGMLDLDGTTRPTILVETIKRNLVQIVTEHPEGALLTSRANEVYGDVLGEARRTHIKQAWDALAKDGAVKKRPSPMPKAGIQALTIYPA